MNPDFLSNLRLFDALDETEILFESLKRRPVIGFFGNSGSGKSTLVNALLGEGVLPSGEASPTQLVTLVGHVEYRPEELSAEVSLFGKGFSPHMIHDHYHVSRHLLEEGGEELFGHTSEAHYAVLFCRAPICRHLWLMDAPGDVYDPGGNCAEKTLGSAEFADGFVFLSPHEGFLHRNDLGLLANIIRRCPPVETSRPMDHVLLVRSRCGNIDAEETVGVYGSELRRIGRQLYETAFEPLERQGLIDALPDEKDIAARVQPFLAESEFLSKKTFQRINEMAKYLIDNHYRCVEEDIGRAVNRVNGILHYLIDASEAIHLSQKTAPRAGDRSAELAKVEKRARIDELIREKIMDRMAELGKSCEAKKRSDIESAKKHFEAMFSEEFLADLIERNFDDEQDALQDVGGYVGQLFGRGFEEVLEKSGAAVSAEIEEMLSQWHSTEPSIMTLSDASEAEDSGYEVSPSDPSAKFIRGFRNVPVLGAVSFYLRSYIIFNMQDSVFNGNIGGYTTSLRLVNHFTRGNSFVKALGSPVTLGLLLTETVGSCARSAGGSWQKNLAAEIARSVREKNIWEEAESVIGGFWRSTEEAIAAGLVGARRGSEEYMKSLLDDLSRERTESELDAYKWSLRKASDFFSPTAPPLMGRAVFMVCIVLFAFMIVLGVSHLFTDYQETFLP